MRNTFYKVGAFAPTDGGGGGPPVGVPLFLCWGPFWGAGRLPIGAEDVLTKYIFRTSYVLDAYYVAIWWHDYIQ